MRSDTYPTWTAFLDVTKTKLPVLFRVVNPLQKAFLLFLFGNIQKKFQDDGTILSEVFFETINLFEPPAPKFFIDLIQ